MTNACTAILSGINPSLVDTNGTYHFVLYSEVSLSQGLLTYQVRNYGKYPLRVHVYIYIILYIYIDIIDVFNPGVSFNRGSTAPCARSFS